MTTPNRSKKGRPEPRKSPLPAILSALAVVAVFVILGFVLANTGNQTASTAPTDQALGFDQTPVAESGAVAAPTAGTTDSDPATAAGVSPDVAARNNKYSAAPPMTIDPAKSYTATITTPRGDIVAKLRPDLAPETVNNFVFLARDGFYDGLTWHRVLQGFMAQGGDPTGTGGGGPGYTIKDEFTSTVAFDKPGLLAMAKTAAPNSAGSQFFITTAAADWLNGQYTIFGEVTSGQEIVDAIPLRDPDANPTQPGETIEKITIAEG